MGRHRIYNTPEEKLAANRSKSKKYYEKAKTQVNKCRRMNYKKKYKRPDSIRVATPEPIQASGTRSPINSWLDQATRVQIRFNKRVNQNPTAYAERICVDYLADRDKDVFHEETIHLAKLQKNIYKCEENILQLSGIGDEHSRVDAIRKVICTTISWIEEIFCYAIMDWAEVQRIYSERGFAYQCI